MYVQSQGPQTSPASFICGRTNQSCVCMCAFMSVYICNCSSHFPQAFELWIIVLVSWTIVNLGGAVWNKLPWNWESNTATWGEVFKTNGGKLKITDLLQDKRHHFILFSFHDAYTIVNLKFKTRNRHFNGVLCKVYLLKRMLWGVIKQGVPMKAIAWTAVI